MAHKSDAAEVDRRVNEIYSLVLAAHSYNKICRYAATKWNISTRQTDRLIKQARDKMRSVLSLGQEEALAEELELRRIIINKTLEDKNYKYALAAAEQRAKLRGLYDDLPRAIATIEKYDGKVTFADQEQQEVSGLTEQTNS
jgi:predicted DNA-binding protein (UPF0251 family)